MEDTEAEGPGPVQVGAQIGRLTASQKKEAFGKLVKKCQNKIRKVTRSVLAELTDAQKSYFGSEPYGKASIPEMLSLLILPQGESILITSNFFSEGNLNNFFVHFPLSLVSPAWEKVACHVENVLMLHTVR